MWHTVAEYADGTVIDRHFPYNENGSYQRENDRQYELECWLIEAHDECTYYSVRYEELTP